MNEAKAIKLCIIHRDPAGFEFLVNMFRKEALLHAVSFLENYEDAADACQDSFHKAYVAMGSLQTLDRFYPWFYVILKNHCLNLIRKKERFAQKQAGIYNSRIQSESTSPEGFLERKENSHKVWEILGSLKIQYREILVMKYAMQKNYADIAVCLGIPRGTVMSRLYNARKAFRDRYLEVNPDNASREKKGEKNAKKQVR